MKIVNGMIEVVEPSVEALFVGEKNVQVCPNCALGSGYREKLYKFHESFIVESALYLTPSQVAPLLEPKDGEWCFIDFGHGQDSVIERHENNTLADMVHDGFYDVQITPLNPFTLQAEKDGILREIVEILEEE